MWSTYKEYGYSTNNILIILFRKFFAQLSIGKPYATKKLVGSKGKALSRSPYAKNVEMFLAF